MRRRRQKKGRSFTPYLKKVAEYEKKYSSGGGQEIALITTSTIEFFYWPLNI